MIVMAKILRLLRNRLNGLVQPSLNLLQGSKQDPLKNSELRLFLQGKLRLIMIIQIVLMMI